MEFTLASSIPTKHLNHLAKGADHSNYMYEDTAKDHLPHTSPSDTVGNHHGVIQVIGDNTGSQAIGRVVSSLNDLINIFELHNALHRAKDLEDQINDGCQYIYTCSTGLCNGEYL